MIKKRRKSKKLKQDEDDLLFYHEFWNEFPETFKEVARREIADLEQKIRNARK